MRKFVYTTAAAVMMTAMAASVPVAAQTGGGIGSVVNCDAPGNRQAMGAILGGIAGAVVGNNVSRGEDAPLVGAVAGAAAGSYVGCAQQRNMAGQQAPAPYQAQAQAQGHGQFYATTNVNVRSGPSTQYGRVMTLSRGQRINVVGHQGSWAQVDLGQNRYGFVSSSYLAAVR